MSSQYDIAPTLLSRHYHALGSCNPAGRSEGDPSTVLYNDQIRPRFIAEVDIGEILKDPKREIFVQSSSNQIGE